MFRRTLADICLNNCSVPTYNNDEIDLVELLRSLFQQKYLILAIASLVTLGVAAYAFLATPHYQVQSLLRPVDRGSLDELNGTGVYELTPAEVLSRVGAGLSSYENRIAFFRENQALFSGMVTPGRSLEQAFEEFNRSAFTMLQVDPKRPNSLSEFVGISLTYPRGVEGVAVVNGLVGSVLESERARIATDLKVLIANRLFSLEQKIEAARASYEASKEARIATLLEEDALQRAQLQDELHALRGELKTRRENYIKQLDEAIQIAESLGIQKPTTPSAMADVQRQGQVVRAEVNSREIPLYFMGSEALTAEREALSARLSDDFSEPRIAEIEKELVLLSQNRQVEILENRQNKDLYLKDLAEWRQEAGGSTQRNQVRYQRPAVGSAGSAGTRTARGRQTEEGTDHRPGRSRRPDARSLRSIAAPQASRQIVLAQQYAVDSPHSRIA